MLHGFYDCDPDLVCSGEQGSDRLCARNRGDGGLPRESWDELVSEKPLTEASSQGFVLGKMWFWTEWLPSDFTSFPRAISGVSCPPLGSAVLCRGAVHPVSLGPRQNLQLSFWAQTDFSLGRSTTRSACTIQGLADRLVPVSLGQRAAVLVPRVGTAIRSLSELSQSTKVDEGPVGARPARSEQRTWWLASGTSGKKGFAVWSQIPALTHHQDHQESSPHYRGPGSWAQMLGPALSGRAGKSCHQRL